MTSLADFFTTDHRSCDESFAGAEAAVSRGDWTGGVRDLEAFLGAMAVHFGMEEDVLFPAFEEATGATGGPTMVMRMEHRQMRGLMDELRAAAAKKDKAAYLGASETLLVMMQQHNMKEEGVLYPMAEDALASEADAVMARLGKLHAGARAP